MAEDKNMKVIDNPFLSELDVKRLWKTLDVILDRMGGIEQRLENVARLEERMDNHNEALQRYGKRLDQHESRIQRSEIWRAEQGDRSSLDESIHDMRTESLQVKAEVHQLRTQVQEVKDDVKTIETKIDNMTVQQVHFKTKGAKQEGEKKITDGIWSTVVKVLVGFFIAYLVFRVTKG